MGIHNTMSSLRWRPQVARLWKLGTKVVGVGRLGNDNPQTGLGAELARGVGCAWAGPIRLTLTSDLYAAENSLADIC